jgi:hypothetical protein
MATRRTITIRMRKTISILPMRIFSCRFITISTQFPLESMKMICRQQDKVYCIILLNQRIRNIRQHKSANKS